MADEKVDVSRLIDERKINSFNIKLLILCFFVILFDGYDIGAAAYAGPFLIKEWGITNRAALAPILSASLAGILFGSPLFGYIGDRFGRKIAIIGSTLTFGVFTLAAVKASGISDLVYLRFLAGIGIGGLLPNVIALTAEFAPKRIRATMIILMFCGITFGGAVPGFISASLVPQYGWQLLFYIGGIAPILMCLVVGWTMSESIKFLVLKTQNRAAILAIMRALTPERTYAENTQFVITDEKAYSGFTPAMLFEGDLKWMTPLLWILFICNLLSFYLINSWTPTVLTSANIPVAHAALATSLFQIGGTIGGLVMTRPIDKYGLTPVAILFALSLPIVGTIGFTTGSEIMLMGMIFFAGFCLLGLQFGLNATSALLYPTAIRTNGSGWAFGVGRFGSISGPLIGGVLVGMNLPLQQFFLLLLVPLGIGTVGSIVLARIYYRARLQHAAADD